MSPALLTSLQIIVHLVYNLRFTGVEMQAQMYLTTLLYLCHMQVT